MATGDDTLDAGGVTLQLSGKQLASAVAQYLASDQVFVNLITAKVRTSILQQARSMGAAGFFGPNAGVPNGSATTKT